MLSILLLPGFLSFVACNKTLEPDDTFIASADIQLIVRGQIVLTYDALNFQLGCNAGKREFRVMDDPSKNYYLVTCSTLPNAVGQELDATVTWMQGGELQFESGTFKVVKRDRETFWLWCGQKKRQIGVAICLLR